ncbi:hypothetical protein DIU31_022705 [Mucilaginibacter rubeus]|uniref:Uncharacterized protein n=2 Tax=Mucilaginibacter rubeus TaxID=2027860 RepID=A0A364WSL0_9SPHI|nr:MULTISPECIES: hypothetical protein [Mucilaginibacter]QEM06189.1 hypothetical protein DIU31_022705 [Mucilaginibacter rubeus]QEM13706.1 hypothetical protein DEO27_028060 [Mucilaginibacter rubeus]QEM18772.1 hypothetical protein DIU38_022945 [Mucilaginibacter gossypii]QTE36233.1 hypothetical protein J3L18_24350 [Mucilaginibacter gossypii]QTE44686.1 hypothetical protein J3L19_04775 [Mucilaginibacter rubeus]
MNFISIQLRLFVQESIDPKNFTGKHITTLEFNKWKNFLKKEVTAILLKVSEWPLNLQEHDAKHIERLITGIVILSNTLNSYILKNSVFLKNHPQAKIIREHYYYSFNLLEELLLSLGESFPGAAAGVKISQANLRHVIPGLKKKFYKLCGHFNEFVIDKALLDIVIPGISALINKKDITWDDTRYISSLMDLLLNDSELDNKKLADLLIIHDFNIQAFYLYYLHRLRERLDDIPGLHEQREMLLAEKDRLYNLTTEKGLIMPSKNRSLFMELGEFVNGKYTFAKKRVKLQRRFIRDTKNAKTNTRFLINLPVPQFGLFIRMQIEKGFLAKENLGELFKFFAGHFYTPNTLYISPDSLQKKSTDVEFATAQKLKGHLIGMINWLNANYNLSNYN